MAEIINLAGKKCVACEGGMLPLTKDKAEILLRQVSGWELNAAGTEIGKVISTDDFMASIQLANGIAAIAEEEGHHPDLTVSWGKLGIRLSTHAIKGLSENDFIMAAKIDGLAGKGSTESTD